MKFHVHNDLDLLFKSTNIPAWYRGRIEVYIMQEDRIVYFGSIENAESFIKGNKNIAMPSVLDYI